MGLTMSEKSLFTEIIKSGITNDRILGYLKVCIREDKTQKNQKFCENMLKKIDELSDQIHIDYKKISKFIDPESNLVKFDDDLYHLTKKEEDLYKTIERQFLLADKLNDLKINYKNTVLLHGESGTGKTTFCRYLSNKLDVPFLYLNLSAVISSFLGDTSSNLHNFFNHIKNKKCVIMIDEIDSLGTKRGGEDSSNREISRSLNSLFTQIDRLSNDVVLIAATNRIDELDSSLLRRFKTKHQFFRLSKDESKTLSTKYLSNFKNLFSEELINNYETEKDLQSEIIYEINELIVNTLEKEL